MTVYVTPLPESVTPDDLVRLFARYGRVDGAAIWVGQNGDAGRVAGTVDMPDGAAAIAAMNGRTFWGREVAVGEPRPWEPA